MELLSPGGLLLVALAAIPIVFAITLHEAAHGYVARMFGDRTAEFMGRITLNPLRHIDAVGTIAVPLGMLLLSGGKFLFGWAKPVPVNFGNLRNPKRDMFWVAAAGPLVNLAMAFGWAMLLKVNVPSGPLGGSAAVQFMALQGVQINLVLMLLNLVPILPLDGGRILVSLLPMPSAAAYARTEPYGFMIVILLLVTGVLGVIIDPFFDFFMRLFGLG